MSQLVYVTLPNKVDAVKLARLIVEKGLVAGVNIIDKVTSIYRWKGSVCEENECILIIESSEINYAELYSTIIQEHSYEVPCIVSVPIVNGYEPFLDWIEKKGF